MIYILTYAIYTNIYNNMCTNAWWNDIIYISISIQSNKATTAIDYILSPFLIPYSYSLFLILSTNTWMDHDHQINVQTFWNSTNQTRSTITVTNNETDQTRGETGLSSEKEQIVITEALIVRRDTSEFRFLLRQLSCRSPLQYRRRLSGLRSRVVIIKASLTRIRSSVR